MPVKAAAGCILRTMGDVAMHTVCIFDNLYRVTGIYTQKYDGELDLTLYINLTITVAFYFFQL